MDMIETIKNNKWKIAAIFIAIVAVIFYLYPKKEEIEIPSEEDSDDKILEFKEEKEKNE